jgi:hypothetical protein
MGSRLDQQGFAKAGFELFHGFEPGLEAEHADFPP